MAKKKMFIRVPATGTGSLDDPVRPDIGVLPDDVALVAEYDKETHTFFIKVSGEKSKLDTIPGDRVTDEDAEKYFKGKGKRVIDVD